VVGLDAIPRQLQGRPDIVVERVERRFDLRGRYAEIVDFDPVEPLGQCTQGRVATGTHFRDDRPNRFHRSLGVIDRAGQAIGEIGAAP